MKSLYIVFEDAVKYYLKPRDSRQDIVYLVKYYRPGMPGKQIVVEDIAYTGFGKRGKTISEHYRIALNYSRELVFKDKEYVLVVNGSSNFDLGLSLFTISNIVREPRNKKISVLVIVPSRDSSGMVKASFYAWLKVIFLYDIFVNLMNGKFVYIFLDSSVSSNLVSYIADPLTYPNILFSKDLTSLTHLKFKRFLIPITEVYAFSELLKLKGELESTLREYRYLLMLMHGVLDNAPTDLWSWARKHRSIIEGSGFMLKKLLEKQDVLEREVRELFKVLSRGGVYTAYLVDPLEVFKVLLQGVPMSRVYEVLNINTKIKLLTRIRSNELVDIYSLGIPQHFSRVTRCFIVSKDLSSYINDGQCVVAVDGVGEISVVEAAGVPLNQDCKINTEYIPFDFYEAYIERSGIALSQLYPPEIIVGDKILRPDDMQRISLVNYYGYLEFIDKECFSPSISFYKYLMSSNK